MPDLPTELTLLGFDFGEQRIGVAIANTISRSARPLSVIRGKSRAQHLAQIAPLIDTWQPQRLVVGLPLLTDGGEQLQTQQARRFARQLHGRFGLPVDMVNEWGSTREAKLHVGAFEDDDDVAAAIILQRWLDEPPHNIK
ncbi:MAG TPA: Holliday junction resolvase RuvX [Paenalcaligenes sp.]|nr:Holliday junction resolvase RuvX [Paenalcaligenes sp.]